MLSNVACVLVYLLCSENFVKFEEKYLWQSLLLKKLQYLELSLFEQVAPSNIITKEFTKYST